MYNWPAILSDESCNPAGCLGAVLNAPRSDYGIMTLSSSTRVKGLSPTV
jgi:hypothetical protein